MSKTFIFIFIVCFIFPVTVLTASQDQQTIMLETNATASLPKENNFLNGLFTFIMEKAQTGANIIKTLGNIKTLALTSSKSAQANPMVSSVVVGAASVGIAASHIYSKGAFYYYNGTDIHFREKIQAAKKITNIEKYSSPIINSPLLHINNAFLRHHEITIELDNIIWLLFSFQKEGLLTKLAFTSKQLVGPDRTLMQGKKVDVSTKRLLKFLKQYDGQEYHLLLSNCRDFSKALWNAIVK